MSQTLQDRVCGACGHTKLGHRAIPLSGTDNAKVMAAVREVRVFRNMGEFGTPTILTGVITGRCQQLDAQVTTKIPVRLGSDDFV